jgi:hypothetical protein
MKAYELRSLAKSILTEMEALIGDLARMTGYVYDPKRAERMERLYDTKIEQIIHRQLKEFQEVYIRSLNMATEKALSEITPPLQVKGTRKSRFEFWKSIYGNQSLEAIVARYQKALQEGNKEFVFFIENILVNLEQFKPCKDQLSKIIKENRKTRIKRTTHQEVKDLQELYGFYLNSQEFTKHKGLNYLKIQKLFDSLNMHFDVPLKKLLAS